MSKKTLLLSFCTQKGGVGKTAFTVLLASFYQYRMNKKIAVIDCDYPQHSIVQMRKRDMELLLTNEHYKQCYYQMIKESSMDAYPVLESTPENALKKARELLENENVYDIIFIDMPGTLNTKGVITTISQLDYLFIPLSADRVVLESTLGFAKMIHENLFKKTNSRIMNMFLFWNMVDGREKSDLYDAYTTVIKKLGLPMLQTRIPDSKRFRKEMSDGKKMIFRSTLLPADRAWVRGSEIDKLANEISNILEYGKEN